MGGGTLGSHEKRQGINSRKIRKGMDGFMDFEDFDPQHLGGKIHMFQGTIGCTPDSVPMVFIGTRTHKYPRYSAFCRERISHVCQPCLTLGKNQVPGYQSPLGKKWFDSPKDLGTKKGGIH